MKSLTVIAALALLPAGALAQDSSDGGADRSEPQPSRWESNHSIVVNGRPSPTRRSWAASSSGMTRRTRRRNSSTRDTSARTAVTPPTRPIIFAYNGGPGSASFWLHMGIMGRRRVVTPNVGQQAPPPYPLVDNGYTLLDIADVVMVDPIGTGFSRPAGDADGSDFWGMDEDASSLTQFIRPS